MFVLPAMFFTYIIFLVFFPEYLVIKIPITFLKPSLVIGGLASILLSLAGLSLLYQTIKPIEEIHKHTEMFMSELGKQKTKAATTRDEGENILQHVTELITDSRAKKTETDRYSRQLTESNRKLAEMVFKDEVTGLYNQVYCKERLAYELLRAKYFKQSLIIAIADLDNFKQYIGRYQRSASDVALKKVGQAIAKNIRPVDILGRYGSGRFMVIMPRIENSEAKDIAEQIRTQIAQLSFKPKDNVAPVSFTISLGLGKAEESMTSIENLIGRADSALFRAKNAGKDRFYDHL